MSNDNDGHPVPVGQPSTDLTYLHPDHLRIGSIGVVAGDWAWTGEPARIPVGFVGTLIQPLLEVAAGLLTDTHVRALLAYVTEQVYAARWRCR